MKSHCLNPHYSRTYCVPIALSSRMAMKYYPTIIIIGSKEQWWDWRRPFFNPRSRGSYDCGWKQQSFLTQTSPSYWVMLLLFISAIYGFRRWLGETAGLLVLGDVSALNDKQRSEMKKKLMFLADGEEEVFSRFHLMVFVTFYICATASPQWLGPEKVPDNWKKIPVLYYRDHGIARNY